MAVRIDTNLDSVVRQLSQALDRAKRKAVPKATKVALERSAPKVRDQAVAAVRKELAITADRAKRDINVQVRGTTLTVVGNPKPIGLKEFGARRTPTGVQYRIKPKGGEKIYRNKYGGSFIVEKLGRHVFVRTSPDPPGPRRARISKLYGPSVAGTLKAPEVQQRLNTAAQRAFEAEFGRAIDEQLSSIGVR